MTSQREKIFDYVKKAYNVLPEYLWQKFPDFAVLRNPFSKKWFGIIMNISYKKLKINKDGKVDVLNVKITDMFLKELLLEQNGFLPAYHQNKGSWISILLDGSVSLNQIEKLLDGSYVAVGIKNKNKKAE